MHLTYVEHKILFSNDKSHFYKYINSRCSSISSIGPIKSDNGAYLYSDLDKTNQLNKQFTSVFIKDNDTIPPLIPPTNESSINNFLFSRHKVRYHLLKLKKSYTLLPDNIPAIIFQMFSYELSIPLTLLFNKSLSLGVFPNKWKLSFIVPIFKKGDPTDKDNYRPISIIYIIPSFFERIIVEHINFYLTTNSIITESQFGFRRGKSVESQLLKCYTHWNTASDNNKFVVIIYLDYVKEFYKVCHSKLMAQLSNIGVVVPILDWIKSFLSNRSQIVWINNTISDFANILSGVPQGSDIGPLYC